MTNVLTSKGEIISRLFTVFQEQGFEGASLADISRATGLGKSSLYHHFPEGKLQMAEAVLDRARTVIDSELLHVARSSLPLKARVRKIVALLNQMYAGGRSLCVLGRLAASEIRADTQQSLRIAFDLWIEAIAILAEESGVAAPRAKVFAEDWVASIQGALILQAASGNVGPFERALKGLTDLGERAVT
jgi:TetR/AcrR family transcriptional regulator, lmrAB and yxaGH operons repressor